MKEAKIYWLFNDQSVAHIKGRPFQCTAIAWKFEAHHDWHYDMGISPNNYYKS